MNDLKRYAETKRVPTAYVSSAAVAPKKRNEEDEREIIIEERITDKYGNVSTRKYLRGKFLGKGGFARCYEVRDLTTNRIHAAKVVAKDTLVKSRARQKLTAEIKIHRSLTQHNIVKFEGFFEDGENVYILLEMCNQKSMMELIKRRKTLTEMEVRYYMIQLLHAVKYMHSQRVIHRDLKLGNLFIGNMQIKIGDFGLATQLDHDGQRKKTICGTPNYIAPEVLECSNGHSYEVDIWSIGVIMYTLIIGKPPFETDDVKTTYKRIRANVYQFPEGAPITEHAKNLIRRILHTVPEARPTIDEILEHPFFIDNYTPTSLPVSALNVAPPSPQKPARAIPSSVFLSIAPTATSQSKSPSRMPLAERTNTNPLPLSSNVNNQIHQLPSPQRNSIAPRVSPAKPNYYNLGDKEDIEEQARKLRKLDDKFKENDLRALLLKTRISEESTHPESIFAPPTIPTTASALPTSYANAGFVGTSIAVPSLAGLSSTSSNTPTTSVSSASLAGNLGAAPSLAPTNTLFRAQSMDTADDEHNHLSLMHQKLAESFMANSNSSIQSVPRGRSPAQPTVWVAKWVDYSNKYGLGYLLSNGVCGAYFNDSTKMVTANQKQCEFIPQTRNASLDDRKAYDMSPVVPHAHEVNKKITLLKYFKHFLSQDTKPSDNITNTSPASNLMYVKKWLRTKRAIVFRLSNKCVQVNFLEDHTKVILSPGAQDVTYVDKNQNFSSHFLASVLQDGSGSITGRDHEELVDRLKYTRDILYHMLNHKKSSNNDNKK